MKEKLVLTKEIIERLVGYSDKDDTKYVHNKSSKQKVMELLDKEVILPYSITIEGEVDASRYDFFDGIDETTVIFNEDGSVDVEIYSHAVSNNAEYDDCYEDFEDLHYDAVEYFLNYNKSEDK